MKPLVAAIAVLVALAVGAQAQTPDTGALRTRAEQGDVDAQWALGVRYEYGRGAPQDAAEAARWYRLAAEQGHRAAQFILGVRYANGDGVPKDDAEAVRWLRLTAEQGHISGQFSLGFMYLSGRGVPQDDAEAVRWYRLAAEQQGYISGATSLEVIYPDYPDDAVPKDHVDAARWYRLAAEQGDAYAQYNLGAMYGRIDLFAFVDDLGLAVPQDLVQAHMWVNLAASRATGSLRRQAVRGRNEIADRMTPDQITEAQRLATAWDAAHPREP